MGFPIESEVVSLRDVLKGKYKIPIYQRPYEWGEKNIDDFLETIFAGCNSNSIFFGTVQFNKEKNGESEDIVDGQQRLTTFILLLNILQNQNNYSEVIESKDLKSALSAGSENQYKSRYVINKELLKNGIDSYCKENNINDRNEMAGHLLKKIYFVKLTTKEMALSDVVSVFNTINTTGLDLNASDIFKFRYYDYLKSKSNLEKNWMEEIHKCYEFIDENNKDCVVNGRMDRAVIEMSWILGVYKHIICARCGWGFSEISKSDEKFFDDLFKENKIKEEYSHILEFNTFYNIVEGFVEYWRWIEDRRYEGESKIAWELLSGCMVEKTRYNRYWTIPFVVAYFAANRDKEKSCEWKTFYESGLKVNLQMFKFFTIYSVINERVIHPVQNKVCEECFKWFRDLDINGILDKINEMMWSPIRWEEDNPREIFYSTIKSGLFDNGSRAHLVCTLSALIDEIENKETIINIQKRLFDWKNNPYDIEHILAHNIFKSDVENLGIYNGIGNLVVLERGINRNIKDKTVDKKIFEYKKSKYVVVKKSFLDAYEAVDWNLENIQDRQGREIEKIKMFMGINTPVNSN